jgi:hypothetical protein
VLLFDLSGVYSPQIALASKIATAFVECNLLDLRRFLAAPQSFMICASGWFATAGTLAVVANGVVLTTVANCNEYHAMWFPACMVALAPPSKIIACSSLSFAWPLLAQVNRGELRLKVTDENILIPSSNQINMLSRLSKQFLDLPVQPSRGNYFEGGIA